MAMTPIPVLDRTSATFKADVDTFFGSQLPAFATEANALQADVTAKQGQAATSATNAATSEGNALASKNAAAISATNAATSEGNALASKNAAAGSFASLDTRYLGAKAVAPMLDNDGNALLIGALYWDTALPGMRSWSGSAWVTLPAATAAAISNTPAGSIVATSVQAAIDELATERYGKDNILGTVSQSAGVPTGALMEYGTNANGEYWRYAGGMQICKFTRVITGAVNAGPSDGIYYFSSPEWTFPATFVGQVVGASESLIPGKITFTLGASMNTSNMSPGIGSMAAIASSTITQSLSAIGRWF